MAFLSAAAACADQPPEKVFSEKDIMSLNNPFSLKDQVPELYGLFLKGMEELRRSKEPPPVIEAPLKEKKEEQKPKPVVELPPAPVVVKRPVLPSLNVTGVVLAGEKSQAIINGSVLWAGDELEGIRIMKIRKGGLDVRYMDFDYEIYFNDK